MTTDHSRESFITDINQGLSSGGTVPGSDKDSPSKADGNARKALRRATSNRNCLTIFTQRPNLRDKNCLARPKKPRQPSRVRKTSLLARRRFVRRS